MQSEPISKFLFQSISRGLKIVLNAGVKPENEDQNKMLANMKNTVR